MLLERKSETCVHTLYVYPKCVNSLPDSTVDQRAMLVYT